MLDVRHAVGPIPVARFPARAGGPPVARCACCGDVALRERVCRESHTASTRGAGLVWYFNLDGQGVQILTKQASVPIQQRVAGAADASKRNVKSTAVVPSGGVETRAPEDAGDSKASPGGKKKKHHHKTKA